MKKSIMIGEVSYSDVLDIRQKVMYPQENREFCVLPDDEKGLHIGYYIDGIPVSVVSLFLENRELQFRKFATMIEYQNQGYGSKLMEWVLDYANDIQFSRVWCNARLNKTEFYKKFGFTETNMTFSKDGHDFVIVEILNNN